MKLIAHDKQTRNQTSNPGKIIFINSLSNQNTKNSNLQQKLKKISQLRTVIAKNNHSMFNHIYNIKLIFYKKN